MRIPIIAGNWKLNKTIGEATLFVHDLAQRRPNAGNVEVVLCPTFTALQSVSEAARHTGYGVAAQDIYWKESGAYTGEVSAPLLKDAGATHVIIGHSERRGRFGVPEPDLQGDAGRVFGDTDISVNKKLNAALEGGLVPIVCVGEILDERNAGQTDVVVQNQVRNALQNVFSAQKVVFAYEPVWAIGTGQTCAPEEADRVCGVVRATVAEVLGENAGEIVRVQYGGSVKPDNAFDLLSRSNIDGALVGGASLQAESFAQIVQAAQNTWQ